jgi:hypothetical protein
MSRVLKLILGFGLMGQAVMAQPAAPPPATAPAPGAVPPASDADISVRQRSVLSPPEMLAQAAEYRKRVTENLKKVQGFIEKARSDKDIIKLNCLTDKLVQLKANLVVVDNAMKDLQEAIARRDEGASVHEYTRITIVQQKAAVLGAEGQSCVGEDLAYVGATVVDVDDSGVPPGDFTDPAPPPFVVDRPPSASPSEG